MKSINFQLDKKRIVSIELDCFTCENKIFDGKSLF